MPVIIRKVVDGRLVNHEELATGEWRLREQVEALEAWLGEVPGRLEATSE